MSEQTPEQLLETALSASCPVEAVFTVATRLRDAGMTQVALYQLYSGRLGSLDDDDPLHDALTDTLDCVWSGGWGQGRDLYSEALSDELLQREGHR